MTNPSRVRLRNLLLLIGLVPLVVALLVALKVGLMLSAQAAGESAYEEGDYAAAGAEFEGNRTVNLLEPWLAPFNHGTALFRAGDPEAAITEFETSLEDVPHDRECQVRINIALAHEVVGDAVAEADRESATTRWQAGRDVLAEGGCPSRDEVAGNVDERLAVKIEQEPEQPDDPEKNQQEQDEQERKRQELEERNQQGREERRENRRYEDYRYLQREPTYQW